jgi:hypothetical protein
MLDSYLEFFSKGYLTKEQFFEFGLESLISSPLPEAEFEWQALKNRIHSNGEVFIRGFGRNSSGSKLFTSLYGALLNNHNVKVDPTNNAEPTRLISKVTGYSKTEKSGFKPISNYQVSHVFGRTKNVFCFTAPWNIVFIPKIIDPLTGHEAKGEIVKEFTRLFRSKVFTKFERQICDYNEIISNGAFLENLEKYFCSITQDSNISSQEVQKLKKSAEEEFSIIEVYT